MEKFPLCILSSLTRTETKGEQEHLHHPREHQ